MSLDNQLPVENADALKGVADFRAGSLNLNAELSQPQDVSAANTFFKGAGAGGGADKFLPRMDHFDLGAVSPGGESLIGSAPGLTPGAEQMSPLIQMILKMPGHISLLGNFFEALGAFFAPVQEALTNVFDPSTFFPDGLDGALGDGLADGGGDSGLIDGDGGSDLSLLDADGGDITNNLSMLPENAPIFQQLGAGKDFFANANSAGLAGGSPLSESFANAPKLNVNGPYPAGKPLFEGSNLNFAPGQGGYNAYSAMGPGGNDPNNFGSSFQNSYSQGAVNGQQANYSQMQGQQSGSQAPLEAQPEAQTETQPGAQPEAKAEAQVETTNYTVKSGDNLWDIAREKLGDGTRWTEIYQMNQTVIGDNPRLIMPGAELQLPGAAGENIASAASEYTVKPGDNLWDISKEHLGSGEHWPDLYQANHDVVGANPDLIHPGDKLQMPSGEHLAESGKHTASLAHHAPQHTAHLNHNSHAAPGHNASPSHNAAPHHAQAPHTAHAAPHHTQAPHTAHAAPSVKHSNDALIGDTKNNSFGQPKISNYSQAEHLPTDLDKLESMSLSANAKALESGT
jgi:LysM repeat protein